jgi:thermitase
VIWSRYVRAKALGLCLLCFLFCLSVLAESLQAKVKKDLKKIQENSRTCNLESKIHPIVAVIDTGIDLNHPDLKASLWINPKEIPNNNVDDDGNGYADDIHGWNFSKNNNDISDSVGHGSHIAGIIASQSRGGALGFSGIAPCARLMILKYYDAKASPQQNLIHTLEALAYAIRMKAEIINYSGGGPGKNPMEESLIREASEKNILLVAAAGNEGWNTDVTPFYPASYGLPNIFAVTAVSNTGLLPYYGNFGKKSVNIAAPGDGIYSTVPASFGSGSASPYGEMSGTSQATAFVTGGAALLIAETRAQGLTLRPAEVIERIVATSSLNLNLRGKTRNGSELSLFRALAMKDRGVSASGLASVNSSEIDSSLFLVRSVN